MNTMINGKEKEILKMAFDSLDNKFGGDIVVLDIKEISPLADFFVIATGANPNQIKAMADDISEKFHKEGIYASHTEGYQKANWILLDFKNIIIHIFDKESRGFYNLDHVWGDAKKIEFK